MSRTRNNLPRLTLFASIPLFCISMFCLWGWVYTTGQLRIAQANGVYPSAEAAMQALIARSYRQPDEIEIIYAGTNSFDGSNPHVWYVIACIWGGTRADGSPVGSERHVYDQPGTFFLATRDGWVHVPEGSFPEFMGFWMKVYGLDGPGSSTPSHDWGSGPKKCEF